jgi:hypothetical protein
MDEHGKDEEAKWAEWQLCKLEWKVAEEIASRSYYRLKLPEIKRSHQCLKKRRARV